MPTYDLIHRTLLGSSQTTINITSIPSTYTDLILYISAASVSSSDAFYVRFNSDSGTNYFNNDFGNQDDLTFGTNVTSATQLLSYNQIGNSYYGAFKFYIPNYARAITKPLGFFVGSGPLVSTTDYVTALTAAYWNSTATISSIQITGNTAQLAAGTSATLYGISNA